MRHIYPLSRAIHTCSDQCARSLPNVDKGGRDVETSAIVAVSFIAGVSAVQVPRAQGKASAYAVAAMDIKDDDGHKKAISRS
jgi:hypothetical protein